MVDPFSMAKAHHEMMAAQYGKVKEIHAHVDNVRMQMDQLMKLGDMISPEDVVKAAGLVVGKGAISATQMAEILGSMPSAGGQPLAGWVRQMDVQMRQAEARVAANREVVQHRLGIAALRHLAADHVRHGPMGMEPASASSAAPIESNALNIESPSGGGQPT